MAGSSSPSILRSGLELSDVIHKVYEPLIRARLGTAALLCEVSVLTLRTLLIRHWKVDIRLPGKGNSHGARPVHQINSHGARPVHQIILMLPAGSDARRARVRLLDRFVCRVQQASLHHPLAPDCKGPFGLWELGV